MDRQFFDPMTNQSDCASHWFRQRRRVDTLSAAAKIQSSRIAEAAMNRGVLSMGMKTRASLARMFALAITLMSATLAMAQYTGAGTKAAPARPKGPCDI